MNLFFRRKLLSKILGGQVKDTRVTCVYDVTSTSSNTKLSYYSNISNYVEAIYIDGVRANNVFSSYKFNTLGNHTVKFKFKKEYRNIVPYQFFYNCSNLVQCILPNNITTLQNSCFYGTHITSFKIPDALTDIGLSIFGNGSLNTLYIDNIEHYFNINFQNFSGPIFGGSNCFNLYSNDQLVTSVTFPSTFTQTDMRFSYCSSIQQISLPDTILSINQESFSNCTNLSTINLPNGITSIGQHAFYRCSNLSTINLPNNVTSIGQQAFYYTSLSGTITIPNSCTSIGKGAFAQCSSQDFELIFPNQLTTIPETCCNGSHLTAVTIPESVTSIGNYAFSYTKLQTISLPNSVITIGENAFERNNLITSITLGSNITSIGKQAFDECDRVATLVIPDSVTSIGEKAFYNFKSLTSLNIGENITSLGQRAFYALQSCNSITVNSNNQYYDSRDNCNGIVETTTNTLLLACRTTTIPTTVTKIGNGAYAWSNYTRTVTIPDTVIQIDSYAFYSCRNITLIFTSTTPPTIGEQTFQGSYTIYVPAESVETYKTATGWSQYASRIQAVS